MPKSLNSKISAIVMGLGSLVILAAPLHAQPAYQVKDTATGSASAPLGGFGVLNGKVFFAGNDGTHGTEPWRSDGTPGGTSMLLDYWTGPDPSNPKEFVRVGNTLFFTRIYDYLMKTDGTAAGTVELKGLAYTRSLTNLNGTLVFTALDGTTSNGNELWRSDGTTAGTVMVKDIYPGPGNNGVAINSPLTVVGTNVFFAATDGVHGSELWKSDGTEAGTVMVKDIQPGATGGVEALAAMANVNGTLYFVANDGTHGRELWKSDGTDAGTVMVKDIDPYGDSNPSQLTSFGGQLFFSAFHTESGGAAYGTELMRSDGTEAGTVTVKDIYPGPLSSNPGSFTVVNGTLFFSAGDTTHGTELWKSDGTEAGTVLVKDINPGAGNSFPFDPFVSHTLAVGNRLFFRADDGTSGLELWTSDGTEAGTVRVQDVRPGAPGSDPEYLTKAGSLLYFSADDGTTGVEPWALNVNYDRSVDFFGDRKTDLTVFHAASGIWYRRDSAGGAVTATGYGGPAYTPVPGDYDGDGKTDLAVYLPSTGQWFSRSSATGNPAPTVVFGAAGEVPVRGDFDGDGKTDLAVYGTSTGLWRIRSSATGTETDVPYGASGYVPMPGDYDGDGKTDLAVYHPPSGLWFIRSSATGADSVTGFGGTGYGPVRGDFDGDGKNDLAVYHPASGLWFIKQSSTGSVLTVGFGGPDYTPVPENYDGDGMTDVAVYHQASGLWFMRSSLGGGTTTSIGFGGPGYSAVN